MVSLSIKSGSPHQQHRAWRQSVLGLRVGILCGHKLCSSINIGVIMGTLLWIDGDTKAQRDKMLPGSLSRAVTELDFKFRVNPCPV